MWIVPSDLSLVTIAVHSVHYNNGWKKKLASSPLVAAIVGTYRGDLNKLGAFLCAIRCIRLRSYVDSLSRNSMY